AKCKSSFRSSNEVVHGTESTERIWGSNDSSEIEYRELGGHCLDLDPKERRRILRISYRPPSFFHSGPRAGRIQHSGWARANDQDEILLWYGSRQEIFQQGVATSAGSFC